jgi:hypothetical protein
MVQLLSILLLRAAAVADQTGLVTAAVVVVPVVLELMFQDIH